MGGGGKRRAPLAEINVTPLVDVMLVLLIIFMVAAPMMATGVDVDLPNAEAPRMETEKETFILSIDADGNVYLGDVLVPRDKLQSALSTNARLQEENEVYVYADASLSYGYVANIFSAIQKAGVEKLGIVTDPASANSPLTEDN